MADVRPVSTAPLAQGAVPAGYQAYPGQAATYRYPTQAMQPMQPMQPTPVAQVTTPNGQAYTLNAYGQPAQPVQPVEPVKKKGMNIWLLLLVLAILAGLILYFTKSPIVMSRDPATNQMYVDFGKVILWAIVIALVIGVILWLLKGVLKYEMSM